MSVIDKSRLLLFVGGTVPVAGASAGDLATETLARTAAITAEADARAADLAAETLARTTAITAEADERAAGLAAEVSAREALVAQIGEYQSARLLAFLDGAGNVLGSVGQNAAWDITLASLRRADGLQVDAFDYNGPAGAVVVDQAGQIVLDLAVAPDAAEIAQARGARDTLAERLAPAISPLGNMRLSRLGRDCLRQLRQRQALRLAGGAVQINHALIGDSFTHNYSRWSGPFAAAMIDKYGDGGGGWTGYGYAGAYSGPYVIGAAQPSLSNGNARPTLYTLRYQGAWQPVGPSIGPDLSHITATYDDEVETLIRRQVPAAPDHTALRLVWIATADGVVRYRVDSGDWTELEAQGTLDSIQSADIALTAGAHTIDIEVIGGTVKLCGDIALSDAPGYRVHKLARSGSKVGQWVAQVEAQQRAGWQLLGIHAWTLMEGTNSQSTPGQTTPTDWKGQMRTMITRMRAASVAADVCLFQPPENQRTGNAHPMGAYTDQARDLACELSCAFIDAQPAFGPDPAEYGVSGAFPLFSSDLVHPESTTGGVQLTSLAVEFHDFSQEG